MPIDETKMATPLTVQEEPDPVKAKINMQNRSGMKHQSIMDLTPGQNLTVLAVTRDAAMTPDEYAAMLAELKAKHGVLAMQTCFNLDVPDYAGFRNDLHLTAHLRIEERYDQEFTD